MTEFINFFATHYPSVLAACAIILISFYISKFYFKLEHQLDKFGERFEKFGERFEKFEKKVDEQFKRVDERAEKFSEKMDERFKEFGEKMDEKFKQVDARFKESGEKIDERFKQVDRRFKELDEKMEGRANKTDKKFERRFDKLDIRLNHSEKRFGRVDDRFLHAETQLSKLDEKTSRVVSVLAKELKIDLAYFNTNSPRQLASLGEKILESSGGKKFVDDNLDSLILALETLKPKSRLDVETGAVEVLVSRKNDDQFTPIKNFIYENPIFHTLNDDPEKESVLELKKELRENIEARKKIIGDNLTAEMKKEFEKQEQLLNEKQKVEAPLNIKITLEIMGIYLRNKFLEKHPL